MTKKLPTTTTRRTVRVIDGPSSAGGGEERLKCPECGAREMHIYKQDSNLYFCGHCAHTLPVVKVKRETTVGPKDGDSSKTFIGQVPRHRKPYKNESPMERNLRDKGYDIQDYYEISRGT